MTAPLHQAEREPLRRAWTRALETTARATRDPGRTLPCAAAELAERYGDRPALIGDEESYSFTGLSARINQYARWGLAQETAKGATVALMMRNRPEYAAIWLGLIRIGVVVALIGPDLKGPALAHALNVAGARLAVASPDGAAALSAAGFGGKIWTFGPGEWQLDLTIDLYSGAPSRMAMRRSSASTIAPCAFSPPAPPVCPKRRRSVIARSSPGRIGSRGSPDLTKRTASTIACRCTTASAAWSPSARRWLAAVRSRLRPNSRPAASGTTWRAGTARPSSTLANFAAI